MQQQVSPGDDTTDSDHGSHQRLLSLNHSVFKQGPEAPPPPGPLSLFSDSCFLLFQEVDAVAMRRRQQEAEAEMKSRCVSAKDNCTNFTQRTLKRTSSHAWKSALCDVT